MDIKPADATLGAEVPLPTPLAHHDSPDPSAGSLMRLEASNTEPWAIWGLLAPDFDEPIFAAPSAYPTRGVRETSS